MSLTLPQLVDANELSYVSFAVWAGVAVRVRVADVVQRRAGLMQAQRTAEAQRSNKSSATATTRCHVAIVAVCDDACFMSGTDR